MNNLPVDRALSIYEALADRSETKGARDLLSKYLAKRYTEGEKDEHRLTVEGLSFLQTFYGEIDART
jgi:predicted transcriptional regulator